MKYLLAFILALLSLNTSYAQEKQFAVLGKVVDSATQLPLAGASAFLQNTTYGTISNAEGYFFLRLPNGGYDLIVTYTGYQKDSRRISNSSYKDDTLVIELVKQNESMEEVAFVQSNEVADGLEKYGQFFNSHFIGSSPNAASCFIQNPESLRFFNTKNKKRNRLKVTAREDLIIINNELGYRIRYQLDSFSYDYNTDISQYTGAPFFEEIDSTEEVKLQWKKNRARTYLGSRLHFMRALYDQNLEPEGFFVEKMGGTKRKPMAEPLTNIYDSSYISENSVVEIWWDGVYRISYKNVFPDKQFLKEFKLPEDTRVQTTILDVGDYFVIEENGYFYEQYDLVNTGYWAWKKLAELLPYDYEYE